MRMIAGSGSRRMRRAGASPATRRSAAICSAIVTESPGIVRLRRGPIRSPAKAAAWSRKPTGADSADRLEELARAVQIDAVALLEIRLSLARDDGSEMENDARALGHELVRLALQRQIRGHRAHLERRAGRGLRRDDVVQGRVRDPTCAQRTALRQLLKELAADHAGRADHQDPIHVNPTVCVIYLTAASSPLADGGRLSFTGRPYMVVPAGVPPCARNEFSVCWSWRAPRSPWRACCCRSARSLIPRSRREPRHAALLRTGASPRCLRAMRSASRAASCSAFAHGRRRSPSCRPARQWRRTPLRRLPC